MTCSPATRADVRENGVISDTVEQRCRHHPCRVFSGVREEQHVGRLVRVITRASAGRPVLPSSGYRVARPSPWVRVSPACGRGQDRVSIRPGSPTHAGYHIEDQGG